VRQDHLQRPRSSHGLLLSLSRSVSHSACTYSLSPQAWLQLLGVEKRGENIRPHQQSVNAVYIHLQSSAIVPISVGNVILENGRSIRSALSKSSTISYSSV